MNKKPFKKIIILAMSCQQEHFSKQEETIRQTWGSDIIKGNFPNIEYYSYTANPCQKNIAIDKENHRITVHSDDTLWGTYEKTFQAFFAVTRMFTDYDYIFRTNTSTYINVPLLNEFVQSLEEDDDIIYCGNILSPQFTTGPYSYCAYAQGNCMLLKRKYVEMITRENFGIFIENDMVERPKDYLSPVRLIDDNVIGGMINTQLILNKKNHLNYYQDFRLGSYTELNPYNYHKHIAVIMKNKDREEKEFSDYLDLHDYMTEYYKSNEPDISFIKQAISEGPIITRIKEKVGRFQKYTKESYIKLLQKEETEIPFLHQ